MSWGSILAIKIKFPSQEEQDFTKAVNELLRECGAKVTAYEVQHPDDHCSYHMTFECGSKRRTIHSDVPFHYDPPQIVVAMVMDWIAGARQANRWTTEVPTED